MPWLHYTDDEVGQFHPEFESAANEALQNLGVHELYEWKHHFRTPGNDVIPDFVLLRKSDRRWLAAVEIKRRKEAVFSTRNQIQAKGYAEINSHLYRTNAPRYYAISNLESTILFALNGERPPNQCRIQGGVFTSGNFSQDEKAAHRHRFQNDLQTIIRYVTTENIPTFDVVWPTILIDFLMEKRFSFTMI